MNIIIWNAKGLISGSMKKETDNQHDAKNSHNPWWAKRKIIVSTDLYPSTAWRWATFDKNQIRTEAKNDSAEDLLIINRDTGNYTLSGYFGKGYSKIVYFKAEGNCKPKDPA